jgi:competence protein ComEC
MRLILGLIAMLMLFGCVIGEEPLNGENVTNDSNETPSPVTIIVEEQENQTIEQNFTEEDDGPLIEDSTTELEYEYTPEENVGVYFIYVGGPGLHGDAILIKKGDFDMLVDAGPQENAGKVVDFLNSRDVDDIEVLVSTNADPRHYGGLDLIADNFDIEHVWWSGDTFGDQEYAAVVDCLEDDSKLVTEVEKGFVMDLNGMTVEVLNPPTGRFEDVNNDAIVTRITDRNFSLLLTSGIQSGAQGKLANEQPGKIKSHVIQAPYYGVGAGTSGIGIFLITADPDDMVISGSADDSPENGGSREPYKRLMNQYDIAWCENYVNGTIRITTDGQSYAIQGLG